MHDFEYVRAQTRADLEHLLDETRGTIIAGGTDLIIMMQAGLVSPHLVIDISRLHDLRYIHTDGTHIHIGPLTTHTDLVASPLIRTYAPILSQAAATIGAIQIRNRGTVGGNLANASPAADTVPALLALDAHVVLRSKKGERDIPVGQFFLGPGKTVRESDEYISDLWFPIPPPDARGTYIKVGRRKAQAIAIVSVGLQVQQQDHRVTWARITLGAVAPTVIRATAAEATLLAQPVSADLFERVAEVAAGEARPISDIRASADYRRRLVRVWVRRALEGTVHQ
jgi:CO/xanthine dehydrogenase FAD-binding subunit